MLTTNGLTEETLPMSRPKILVKTAKIGARMYTRQRDLPGAIPGLLSQPPETILPRLVEAEAQCEAARRARSASYRPARHVQILSALLAEAAAAQRTAAAAAHAGRAARIYAAPRPIVAAAAIAAARAQPVAVPA